MLNATEHEIIGRAREELVQASHGRRGDIVRRVAATLGRSERTVNRMLAAAGYVSGSGRTEPRKQRSDARKSVLSDVELELVAGVLRASLNKKGQRMPVRTALDMLLASGQLRSDVHESTVSRQLYQRMLHPEQMALPEPSLAMRSLHPNHVWQCDSTTGAYYYLPGGRLRWMPEDQFYKNKVSNLVKASSDLLTRYAIADHFAHPLKFRYYLGGETAENLLDFLCWAMWKQDGNPFHGVPRILVMDPGAANKSHVVRNFCKRLGIQLLHHAPGAARVTGSVEKAHDIARMHFETRFRFRDPADVTLDKLNADIEAWSIAYCSHAIHGRHKQSRFGAWMAITPEQLRVAASLQALRDAAVREPETRRVSNDKRITFGSPSKTYYLGLVPGVVAGLPVTVASNPFRAPAIDVLFTDPDTGEETWHVVEPEELGAGNFPLTAPVWGEDHRRASFTELDKNRTQLTREAYRTGDGLPSVEEAEKARKAHRAAFEGVVDSMADVKATPVPTFLPRKATQLQIGERQVAARRLNVVEACKRLRDMLGDAYSPQVYRHVEAHFSDPVDPGVPEDQLAAVAALFRAPLDGEDQLRAMQGSR